MSETWQAPAEPARFVFVTRDSAVEVDDSVVRSTTAWTFWVFGWCLAVGGVAFVLPAYLWSTLEVATFVAGLVGAAAIAVSVLAAAAGRVIEEDDSRHRSRARELTQRFGRDAAELILAGEPWQGASREMMIEALGEPEHEEKDPESGRIRLAYRSLAADRFELTVELDQGGTVVDWQRAG